MSFGSRLKELREQKGLKQQDLAKILGVKNTAVSNYELGISSPREETMFKIFEYFNTTPNYMFQDDVPIKSSNMLTPKETTLISKYRELDYFSKKVVDSVLDMEHERCTASESELEEEPKLQMKHSFYKVSAGHGFDLTDDDNWGKIEVPDTPEARKADFALTIEGDSMEPVFLNGDIVLVKQQDAIDLGQIGIFWLNGSGYIKKFAGDRLISLNEEYEDIIIAEYDDYRCFGKVIGRV